MGGGVAVGGGEGTTWSEEADDATIVELGRSRSCCGRTLDV